MFTGITITPTNASGWQGHVNLLVNGEVAYTSDPFTVTDDQPFTATPPVDVGFARNGGLQVELVAASGTTSTTGELLRADVTISGIPRRTCRRQGGWQLARPVTHHLLDVPLADCVDTGGARPHEPARRHYNNRRC